MRTDYFNLKSDPVAMEGGHVPDTELRRLWSWLGHKQEAVRGHGGQHVGRVPRTGSGLYLYLDSRHAGRFMHQD